ncbi:DUF11 domain-containing protein [Candidatus Chlorohelix sp.]|uniref:COG1361 S-layer family protein n=1 Tax=Candidatus Chlorohelix sp. TaxID=3139201 RepID=UPI003062F1EA
MKVKQTNRFRKWWILPSLFLVLSVLFFQPASARAEGSRDLYPTDPATDCASATGPQYGFADAPNFCRANLEWRTSFYGPSGSQIARRTLLKVFARTGEHILVGSSAMGIELGDIAIYSQGVITGPFGRETVPDPATSSVFRCSVQGGGRGLIDTRLRELGGPTAISVGAATTNNYLPCYYQAPATGVYDVVFTGPEGFSSDNQNLDPLGPVINFLNDARQSTSVSAWDVTVRSNDTASTTDLRERLFSYSLAMFTGGNHRPINSTIYIYTNDGYRYETKLNQLDPNGYLIYANNLGYLDSDGVTPLYHDVQGNTNRLELVQGGVSLAPPQYPIFFSNPNTNSLPTELYSVLKINPNPPNPIISNLNFIGSLRGNTSVYSSGGTFSYNSNIAGTYQIVISRDGVSFDPANPQNRVLRGFRNSGAQTVVWDGRDNSGVFFPVGNGYRVVAQVQAGEYHFPLLDAENSIQGAPGFILQNPPTGNCNNLVFGCSTTYYDDRGYRTLNGTVIGVIGQSLCGLNPPAIPVSLTGYNSTAVPSQRTFGSSTLSNGNGNCDGAFGDRKGLDVWINFPSQNTQTLLNIVDENADIEVIKTANTQIATGNQTLVFTVTVSNRGPGKAPGVQVTDVLPTGLNLVTSSTSQGTYNPTTGVWDIGLMGAGRIVTLQIAATFVNQQCTPVTNLARKTHQDNQDSIQTNDSSSVRITCAIPQPPLTTDPTILKTVDKRIATPGQTVTFSIAISNPGPGVVNNALLSDDVPLPFQVQNATSTLGTVSISGQAVRVNIGTFAAGASATLTITTLVLEGSSGSFNNTAILTGDVNGNPISKSSTATVAIPPTDPVIVKTADVSSAVPGQTVRFTINFINPGPLDVTNAVIKDDVPLPFKVTGATSSLGTVAVNGQAVQVNIGAFAVGASGTLIITTEVQPGSSGSFDNTAFLTGSINGQPFSKNSAATVKVPTTDPTIVKTADVSSAVPGQTVTFTIKFTNPGAIAVNNAVVKDEVPLPFKVMKATSSLGTVAVNGQSVQVTIGNFAAGASDTLVITTEVQPGSFGRFDNTASLTGDVNGKPITKSSTATVSVPPTDPTIIKTADVSSAIAGQTVKFTINFANAGQNVVNNALIKDEVPLPFKVTGATSSLGTVAINGQSVQVSLGDFASGTSGTLVITTEVQPGSTGSFDNTAVITGDIGGTSFSKGSAVTVTIPPDGGTPPSDNQPPPGNPKTPSVPGFPNTGAGHQQGELASGYMPVAILGLLMLTILATLGLLVRRKVEGLK